MNPRQEQIATLQTAWQLYLPSAEPLSERSARVWSHHTGDSDLALKAIEATGARHAREPLRCAEAWCWTKLKSDLDAYFRAHPQQDSEPMGMGAE